MKRSTRISIYAAAAIAAMGMSTAPAAADQPAPDMNGYTHAIASFDIRCFGLGPNILDLPAGGGFAIFDRGDGNITATLGLPAPFSGEFVSHVDFKWRNLTTGQSGSQHVDSRRFFGAPPQEFDVNTGKGRILLTAFVSNSSSTQPVPIPMTPCASLGTVD
ncbi:hypothetical protein [Rhodococcus sp. NPDC058521]|uniref:hypothetical protein n=1 Tax=Rhodococcus sp. NPDC058521 TaxID=3346536 RepID=UPI00365C7C51